MSTTTHVREKQRATTEVREEQRTTLYWQGLRLVEAEALQSRSRTDILELVGLALIVLAAWFFAALIFVPGLAGLL